MKPSDLYNFTQIKISVVQEFQGSYMATESKQIKEFWDERIAAADWFDNEKEHLVVIILDTKYKIKNFNLVSIGTVNESLAHPREIMRPVIAQAGAAFILMHNHPSGDPTPSQADRILTRKIQECAQLFMINFLDHVIMGEKHFSFREAGLL